MGSIKPITFNICMKHLIQNVILTAPLQMSPKLWQQYVDDILDSNPHNDNTIDHLQVYLIYKLQITYLH